MARDNGRESEIAKFLETSELDPEVLKVRIFLEDSGVALPLILCDSEERIVEPIPSRESRAKSYLRAAQEYVMFKRFFSDEGSGPVILSHDRIKIFPEN